MDEREIPPRLARRHEQWFYAAWCWMLADYAIKVLGIVAAALTPYLRHSPGVAADVSAITAAVCSTLLAVVNPGRTASLFWAASRVVDTARRKHQYEDGTIRQVNAAFNRGEALLQGWQGVSRKRNRRSGQEPGETGPSHQEH